MEGLWHEVSDEDLPSDGGTTSPQGRADGTGEHYGRDLKKKLNEQIVTAERRRVTKVRRGCLAGREGS